MLDVPDISKDLQHVFSLPEVPEVIPILKDTTKEKVLANGTIEHEDTSVMMTTVPTYKEAYIKMVADSSWQVGYTVRVKCMSMGKERIFSVCQVPHKAYDPETLIPWPRRRLPGQIDD